MMRVFRPTSPMNMGAWILSGAAPTAIATGLFINRGGSAGQDRRSQRICLRRLRRRARDLYRRAGIEHAPSRCGRSRAAGCRCCSQRRRWPAPGAVLHLLPESRDAKRAIAIFAAIGRIGELAAGHQVELSASAVPRVGEPFRKGAPSVLWKAAKILTAASLVVSFAPGKSPAKRRAAAILATGGSLCLRFAVHYLTNASARDPRASFEQQRRRMEA